jgi:hypothetical protein
MNHVKTIVSAAVLGLLAAGATTAPATAAEASPTVSGHVENADSTPAEGATVTVYADPRPGVRQKVGEISAMLEVGSDVVDADGRYSVSIAPGTLARVADDAGVATFNVSVLNRGTFQSGPAQLKVASSAPARTAARRDGASIGRATSRADFDFGNARLTRTATRRGSSSAGAQRSSAASSVSVEEDYGPRYVFFGQFISLVPDVKHRIDYTVGSETSLGWAVSSTGEAGTFSAGGTQVKSADRSVWGETTGKVVDQYRTQFVYQKRHYQTCTAGWTCDDEYRIEPVSYAGGFDTYTDGSVPWPKKCVPQEPSSGFTTSDSEGYTFDYGVSIAGMTTVQLSARTNFSNTVKQEVRYPTGGFTCGLDDYPGGLNPHVISADTVNRGASTTSRSADTISMNRVAGLEQ